MIRWIHVRIEWSKAIYTNHTSIASYTISVFERHLFTEMWLEHFEHLVTSFLFLPLFHIGPLSLSLQARVLSIYHRVLYMHQILNGNVNAKSKMKCLGQSVLHREHESRKIAPDIDWLLLKMNISTTIANCLWNSTWDLVNIVLVSSVVFVRY